jgi:hypothetical protein
MTEQMKQVTFYTGIGLCDPASAMITSLINTASYLFGGCTITQGWGGWCTPEGVVREQQLTIVAIGDIPPDAVKMFSDCIATRFCQECIMVVEQEVTVSYLNYSAAGPVLSSQSPATPTPENNNGATGTDR